VTQATGNSEAGQQSRLISKGSRYDLVLGGHGGGINFRGLVMRFLMTVNGGGRAPDEQMYAQHGAVRRETDPGVLLATGGLDRGTHVVASGENIIAGLARLVRDVGLAEELAQDALVAALEQWPVEGIPARPGAWLMLTAKYRAIDPGPGLECPHAKKVHDQRVYRPDGR
jgi:hypothetical protein